MIRLKRDLRYYLERYGNPLFGFHKLFLLMEKQHNRGQDGSGIGCLKLNMPLGQEYLFRDRELEANALSRLFRRQLKRYDRLVRQNVIYPELPESVKAHFDYGGELLMGHLRYGTSGRFTQHACHPYARKSNWPTRSLMLCGNFNMTNTAELNAALIERGQHPVFDTDTQTVLEEIGFFLDEAHNQIYRQMRDGGLQGQEIASEIGRRLDLAATLRRSARLWDGGYTLCGIVGSGDAFMLRDPNGIRPAHYVETEDFVACASERVPLLTVFNLPVEAVQELPPGHVLLLHAGGEVELEQYTSARPKTSCSFERIYFSRPNDPDIYTERKALGAALAEPILETIDGDLAHAVFSFIPNTAEVAHHGLIQRVRELRRQTVRDRLLEAQAEGVLTAELIDELVLGNWPRAEKIAHKDIKLRTFISQEDNRSRLVSHVYDITYGVVQPEDTLIVLDDSIVRGTTLRESIVKILARTRPRRIVVASTAPQIRYPDCYGIDMADMGQFIAFQATVALLREKGAHQRLRDVYEACREQVVRPACDQVNAVKSLYEPFSDADISARIAELLYPHEEDWQGELVILYQGVDALHAATPEHTGDWYFTGDYPTPGGTAVCNQAFINSFENRTGRSYEAALQPVAS